MEKTREANQQTRGKIRVTALRGRGRAYHAETRTERENSENSDTKNANETPFYAELDEKSDG